MPTLTSAALEIGTAESYYDQVMSAGPAGFWMLNELKNATGARDLSAGADGTYSGSISLGQAGPFPHGGTCATFVGGHIDMGDAASTEVQGGSFSVEFVARWSADSAVFVSKTNNTPNGWYVFYAAGAIGFAGHNAAGVNQFALNTSSGVYDDNEWHHIACTWDGTTGADGVKIYVDGVVNQATATGTSIGGTAAKFMIGINDGGGLGDTFVGLMAGVAVYDSVLSPAEVLSHYASLQWTDLTADMIVARGNYGLDGLGPLDRLADSGTLVFSLNNSANNSANLLGYYSPNHVNCRAGFTFNAPVRVTMTYNAVTYTKFWGRLVVIDPEPGQYLGRRTNCVAHDYFYTLADTDVRSLPPQINQSEGDLIRTILEALPPNAQPMGVDIPSSVDTYPYAFHDLSSGVKAATALNHVLISAWGYGVGRGDGMFRYYTRSALSSPTVEHILGDDMVELETPTTLENTTDWVRVTTHPTRIGATATEVLFSQPSVIEIATGETLELWGTYSNPSNRQESIGGTDFVDPLVDGTDFEADTVDDGSGTDISADIDITASLFASNFQLLITNTNGATAYLVNNAGTPLLQIRGRGIYTQVPVISESRSVDAPIRPMNIDLPYQDNVNTGQAIADYVLNERVEITNHVERILVQPMKDDALMLLVLEGEPQTVITISETLTGLHEAQCAIRSIGWTLRGDGLFVDGEIGVRPLMAGAVFRMDVDQLDDTDVGLGAL